MISDPKTKRKLSGVLKPVGSLSLLALMVAQSVHAQNSEEPVSEDAVQEEVLVTGFRKALKGASDLKRDASQIVDAISAEDIGKLPDSNIAEALARVSGLTIGRDAAGDGTSFQIRGFSANSLTINGKSVVTDGFDNRENNLNALSSSIVKAIEVSKTPTADQIEGGTGGSVELVTFSPLDFEGFELRTTAELNDNSLKSDPGYKLGGLISNRWETNALGEFGVLVNAEVEERNQYSEGWDSRYAGTSRNGRRTVALLESLDQGPDHPAFYGRETTISQSERDIDQSSLSLSLQWAPNDSLDIKLDGQSSSYTQLADNANLRINTQSLGGYNAGGGHYDSDPYGALGITLEPGATWSTLTRPVRADEYDASTLANPWIQPNGQVSGNKYTSADPATGDVSRSFLTSGIFLADSRRNNQASPLQTRGNLWGRDKSSENWALDIDWKITDGLTMTTAYAISESETDDTNRQLEMRIETLHPETGERLYPSIGYDIRDGGDVPSYEILWREPVRDDEGNVTGGQAIAGFDVDFIDPAQRNDLHRIERLNKNIHRTRAYGEEFKVDFDWEVDFAGVNLVEFGYRQDSLDNYKNRSDFETPFTADGAPPLYDEEGFPIQPDQVASRPNRTLTALLDSPLDDDSHLTAAMIDDFLTVKDGMQGVSGTFPNEFWSPSGSTGDWDNFINAVYGGHSVLLNDTQTEKVGEDTSALYLKFNFEYDLAGMPLTGNVGMRYVETEGFSEAYIAHCNVPWAVDTEKTSVARAEEAAYQADVDTYNADRAAWIAGGQVGPEPVAPTLSLTHYDEALTLERNRNRGIDPNTGELEAIRPQTCTTRTEPGGPQLRIVFEDEPWRLADGVDAQADLRAGTSNPNGEIYWKDWLTSNYDYSVLLPSLNLNLGVTDDMVVRFAAYETMARPGGNDLSLDPANRGGVFTQGNPNLKPFKTESFDLAWEWYPNDTDYLSVTYFHKNLIDQKVDSTEFNNSLNRLVREPINGGDGKVDGFELGGQHVFDYLPGLLSGFGVMANYTIVDSTQVDGFDEITGADLPVVDRSETAYNLQMFYEKNGWNFRVAYNWRDMSLRGDQEQDYWDSSLSLIDPDSSRVAGQPIYDNKIQVNPRNWNEAYGQMDFSAGYDFDNGLSTLFKVTNVTEEAQRSYTYMDNAVRQYNLASTFYRLSLNWQY